MANPKYPTGYRECYSCHQVKPLSEFYQGKKKHYECKVCSRKGSIERAKKRRESGYARTRETARRSAVSRLIKAYPHKFERLLQEEEENLTREEMQGAQGESVFR